MKIKALLFAAVAMTSLCASAGTPLASTKLYANDVTLENATDKAVIGIIVENPEQPDLSFFQFVVEAPEGFQFVQLSKADAGLGTQTKLNDAIVAGIAAEDNDDHSPFSVTVNLADGGYVLGQLNNEPLGVNDGTPVLYIAAQATSKAVNPGEYTFTIYNITVTGGNTDQALYGELPNSTFKVTVPGEATAVTDINAKAVAGVKYYNLAGVESNVPFDGVNVVVTTYTDGTKAASKVIK
jgi:hypothetical protein